MCIEMGNVSSYIHSVSINMLFFTFPSSLAPFLLFRVPSLPFNGPSCFPFVIPFPWRNQEKHKQYWVAEKERHYKIA